MSIKKNNDFYKNLLLACIFLDYIVIFLLYIERMFLTCPAYKLEFIQIADRLGIDNDVFIYTMVFTSMFLAIATFVVYYVINIVVLYVLKPNDIGHYKLTLSILIAFSISLLFAFCILSLTSMKPDQLIFKLLVGFSTPLIMSVLFNDAFTNRKYLYYYSVVVFLIGYFMFWSEMQIFRI